LPSLGADPPGPVAPVPEPPDDEPLGPVGPLGPVVPVPEPLDPEPAGGVVLDEPELESGLVDALPVPPDPLGCEVNTVGSVVT
jgi:hypothetical protein